MKIMIGLIGLATLMLTSGCIIEPGHRGGSVGVYEGEYPHRVYGGERYEFHSYHPYDRDHYWR